MGAGEEQEGGVGRRQVSREWDPVIAWRRPRVSTAGDSFRFAFRCLVPAPLTFLLLFLVSLIVALAAVACLPCAFAMPSLFTTLPVTPCPPVVKTHHAPPLAADRQLAPGGREPRRCRSRPDRTAGLPGLHVPPSGRGTRRRKRRRLDTSLFFSPSFLFFFALLRERRANFCEFLSSRLPSRAASPS